MVYIREDQEGYNPSRQWPDLPLPTLPPDAPEQEAPPAFDPEKVKCAMAVHHLQTDFLKGLGFDPCKEYAENQVTSILEAVMPHDKRCPICKEELFNTQRLKAHLRAKHMEKTPFYCSICDKYFGDKATLNLHNRKHDTNCPLFICNTCQKVFTVQSRLREHQKSHLPQNIDQPCRHCGKTIKERKNLVNHEKFCKMNPEPPARLQCPYCARSYIQKKDLRKHCKDHHKGRDWEKDFVPQG